MNKEYWNDLATKGAILGALMLVSHIFEQSAVSSGSMTQMMLMLPEMLAVCVLYIYLLYRFAKRASAKYFRPETGFPYGQALVYTTWICVFAGIIVGLGDYIYIHFIIGYDNYVQQISESISNLISASGLPSSLVGMYENALEQLADQPEPGVVNKVLSTMISYGMSGLIIGLIVAAIVKREPDLFGSDNKGEGEKDE